jgi:oxygen-independent coproporphyrinogen-3 oxidase
VRWWNVLRPETWAARLAGGCSPAAGRERLGAADRHLERVMLGVRLAEGLPLGALDGAGREQAARLAADGLLDPRARRAGRAVLTLRGRLVADGVVRALLGLGAARAPAAA